MPTYQYLCTECGEALEVQQSFSDDALTVCPVCEGRLRKVFNAVGVVFKGSGFYRNDSRATTTSSDASKSEPSKNGAKAGSSGEGSSSDGATKKESSTNGSSSNGSSGSGSSTSTTPASTGG
ncbi:FmdB family zinc ribbon protein [Aeromicrobium sp.]|uniref:FmdB family zinc ribbon protein n=1 Tax=Aeromicrobium sp. TaxID=1871063 RepID=UPI003C31F617